MKSMFVNERANALVIAKNWDVCSDLTDYLPEFGIPFLISESFEKIPYDFLHDHKPSYIFVCIDDFGGAICAYDQICELRENMADTSIILVSREFSTDEYGTHRSQLADVSIRYPFSKSTLLMALKQAPVNLSTWKKRLEATTSVWASLPPAAKNAVPDMLLMEC